MEAGSPPHVPRIAALAVIAILVVGAIPGAAPAGASPSPQFASEILGGKIWIGEFQVSNNNGVDDDEAQVNIGPNGTLRFLWLQESAFNGSFMFAEWQDIGTVLQNETFVASNLTPTAPMGQPHGDQVGVDSRGDFHLVREAGPQSITYEKVASNGTTLVGPRIVGPADGQNTSHPALAVGTDDTIHIAHNEYKFQCEDVAYDKLSNNSTELWIDRIVSSDVASNTEPPIVRIDPYSGNVMFTFGSSTGTWLGRYNKFGAKDMPSVKIRNETDGKPVDVASTPDGTMHMVWSENGSLLYSAVNASGVRIVNRAVLESGGTVGAFPRLAGASDGEVMVVWADNRSGSLQVWAGAIPRTGNLSAWSAFQFTTSAGVAFEPVVTFDPDDQAVVAWTDTRDGDREIFFKREAGCAMELYADPIDLSGGFFLHPNETKVLTMYLKNKGLLTDSFVLDLTYSAYATQMGWTVSLDPTLTEDIAPGQSAPVNLTIHTPANATQGAHIDITVNASSLTYGDCWDRIDLSEYVMVTRSLGLTAPLNQQAADNGEAVTFNLTVTNTGDVPETVQVGVLDTPQGWNASVDTALVSLEPHAWAEFRVLVEVPTDIGDAPGNMLGRISVLVRSTADSSVTAVKEVLVSVNPRIVLVLRPEFSEMEVRPGYGTDYNLSVANEGNLAGQAKINLAFSAAAQGLTAFFDRETVYLRGGEHTNVHVNASLSPSASPGTSYNMTVEATAVQFGLTTNTTLSARVPPLCRGGAALSAVAPPVAGGRVSAFFDLESTGALPLAFDLTYENLPLGWRARALVSSVVVGQITMAPPVQTTVEVEFTPEASALGGDYPVRVHFAAQGCDPYTVDVNVAVPPAFAFTLEAAEDRASAGAGATATYVLVARNLGNTRITVALSAEELPGGFMAAWRRGLGGGSPSAPIAGSTFELEGFSNLSLLLDLAVPTALAPRTFSFEARASPSGGAAVAVPLQFTLALPDIEIAIVDVSPANATAGQNLTFTLIVRNIGTDEAAEVEVTLTVDGAQVASKTVTDIGPSGEAIIVFQWTATEGTHAFAASASSGGDESGSTADNLAAISAVVAPATGGPPAGGPPTPSDPASPGGAFVPIALGAAAAISAAGAVLFLLARRKSGGGLP